MDVRSSKNSIDDLKRSEPPTSSALDERQTFLKRIGLHDEAVEAIMRSFDPEIDTSADISTYVECYVLSHRTDEYIPEEYYEEELRRCGLSEQVARQHMAPEDSIFRSIKEPWTWALDTLKTNIAIHEQVLSTSDMVPSNDADPISSSEDEFGDPVVPWRTRPSILLAEKPRPPSEEEVIWYKSGIDERFRNAYDGNAHAIEVRNILSLPPSDVAGLNSCLYYTDSLGYAMHYARWSGRRANSEDARPVILRHYIPKAWIHSLQDIGVVSCLTTSQFQELVWWSYRLSTITGYTETNLIRETLTERRIVVCPINAITPAQVRGLENESEIKPMIINNSCPNQICILYLHQNYNLFNVLKTFEALLSPAT
ncbi:hypothetical protein FQN51_009423 [Onygenales sp. PD_10]|nr:hypothetical protein FQN51_009423 [Onygenales sp. PD_10]